MPKKRGVHDERKMGGQVSSGAAGGPPYQRVPHASSCHVNREGLGYQMH